MKRTLSLIPLLLLAGGLVGCGGGGAKAASAAKGGRATFRVAWPARDARFVPLSANSLVITVSLDGAVLKTQPIRRPTNGSNSTTVTLDGLKYGNLSVSVKAYPTVDGTGTAQATGAGTVLVADGTNNGVAVNLASTVDHLSLSGTTTVLTGGTSTLVATAYDASGAMVLLKADAGGEERLTWTSDDPHATVVGTGATAVVTGAANGSATIKATFQPDGGVPLAATRGVTVADVFYKPGVVVLPVGAARQATLSGSTLTVTGDVSDIAVGTVVLSSQGKGLTRKVTGLNGGGAFATTAATVEEAILVCDRTASITMDAAEGATYSSAYSGVANATGATGDLKMTYTNLDLTSGYTKGLILNGSYAVKVGITVHLKMEAGKVTTYETTVRDQGASDIRVTPKAAGTYALFGTPYAGMLTGSWEGHSRELLPGVALTPGIYVQIMPGYNEKFYNGLDLRLQVTNDATVALRYTGGTWTSDGNQTSTVDGTVAPTKFPRGTLHLVTPVPEALMALNGVGVTNLDGGVYLAATTSDVAGPPAALRLVVDGTYTALSRAYKEFLGGNDVTRDFTIQPPTPGIVDKTILKNTGGGDVTIQ